MRFILGIVLGMVMQANRVRITNALIERFIGDKEAQDEFVNEIRPRIVAFLTKTGDRITSKLQ